MRDKFVIELPLRYQDTDTRLRATLPALLGAMQEAAIQHSEAAGRGIRWLAERKLSWVIVQTRATFPCFPDWGTTMRVTTWPSDMGRLLSRREFVFQDPAGDTLLRATTLWAFMDTARRRVCRIPAEVAGAYDVFDERALERPFRRPGGAPGFTWEERFAVRRWEIDFNGHVNNLRYIDWMLETVPEDLVRAHRIREVDIRYEKETRPGEAVVARAAEKRLDTSDGRHIVHQVVREEDGASIARAETIWISDE